MTDVTYLKWEEAEIFQYWSSVQYQITFAVVYNGSLTWKWLYHFRSSSSWNLSTMFLLLLFFYCTFFLTLDSTHAGKCRQIDFTKLPACANVGYKSTANFSQIGEQSYQDYVSSKVTYFSDRFNSCSPYSRMFVCSRYLPKCSKDVEGPILPCREVCDQFLDDCHKELKDSGLYRRYVAYCRLLSSKREASMQCLKPSGFVPRPNKKGELKKLDDILHILLQCCKKFISYTLSSLQGMFLRCRVNMFSEI